MSDFLDMQGAKDLNTDAIHLSAVANSVDPATGAPIDTHVNRVGSTDYTLQGFWDALGPVVMPWTSVFGGTLTQPNQAFLHPANGNYYSWTGAYPTGGYVVAPGTDPTAVAGYVPRTDVVLRNQLAAPSGTGLVSYYNMSLDIIIGKLFHASVLAAKLGVTLDATGGADSTAAIQAIVEYVKSTGGGNIYFEPGTYKHSGVDCSELGSKRLKIIGAGKGVTKFNFTGSGTAFLHTENFEIDGCTITNISGSKATAIALGTPTTRQAAYCSYTRIGIGGFKFGLWWRYSLWNTVRDFHTYDCLCGAKLSRNAFPHDQSNPQAPSSWNLDPGFFHNQNTWDNVVFEDGEVGFWGTVNGNSFHNVTAQKQSNASGASNTVIPVGMAGVGAWFQNGSGTSTFGAQGNYIDSFYTEFTRQPFIIEYSRVGIGSYYVQGGSSSDKYPQVFKLTGTTLDARGMSPSGSDWFNYGIVAVDSFIVGNPLSGIALSAGLFAAASHQMTNTIWNDLASSKATNKTWTPSGASTLALLTMSERQLYTVVVGGMYDGSSMRSAQFEVYFHTSGFSRVMGHPSNSTDITCTVSGTTLNLNVTGASFYDIRVTAIINRALGNFPVTG